MIINSKNKKIYYFNIKKKNTLNINKDFLRTQREVRKRIQFLKPSIILSDHTLVQYPLQVLYIHMFVLTHLPPVARSILAYHDIISCNCMGGE